MSLRAAELLDDGMTDEQVYRVLKKEFPGKLVFSARTVGSFRRADYSEIAAERLKLRESAERVGLIMGAAQDAGATFAESAHGLLMKVMLDAITANAEELSAADLARFGKTLAKFREVEIEEDRVEMQRRKLAEADAIKTAARRKMAPEELVAEVDRNMGLKK